MENHQAIRDQLTARYAVIRDRLAKIEQDLRHAQQPPLADFAEQASEAENEQVLDALDHSIRQEMAQIEATIERMERGEYGVCKMCGRPIPLKRLKALPEATHCVACEARRAS